MRKQIFKVLQYFICSAALIFFTISDNYSMSNNLGDSLKGYDVKNDGSIIVPTDTMRSWIEYQELILKCLNECNNCLTVPCSFICDEICNKINLGDNSDASIVAPTDTARPIDRLTKSLTDILQQDYLLLRALKLNILSFKKTLKNIAEFQELKKVIYRLEYVISNFELIHINLINRKFKVNKDNFDINFK